MERLRFRVSPITAHPAGASPFGCEDMAGNVWAFVQEHDRRKNRCVLRGGSFRNGAGEVKAMLRLIEVPMDHRAEDFSFRLAQLTSPY